MLDPYTTIETDSLWLMTNGNVFRLTGNVGIGTDSPTSTLEVDGMIKTSELLVNGTALDPSAIVQLDSTDKGILIPRMLEAERLAIATPADSLLVYQTDETKGFYYFDDTEWKPIGSGEGGKFIDGTNPLDAVYMDGKVGVGTETPTTELEVVGDITSTGTKWEMQTAPLNNAWIRVVYGNGLFVAIGYGNSNVMTSPNGVNWTTRPTGFGTIVWYDIIYGGGLFVALSLQGTTQIMTSIDGVNWVDRGGLPNNQWVGLAYGNNTFVAVSQTAGNPKVMYSSDGINWTGLFNTIQSLWLGITYGNGLFVAVAKDGPNERVMTSPDGINWTGRTAPANSWDTITYGNGIFVAVTTADVDHQLMTSPDGVTWTSRATPVTGGWFDIAYGDGLFVAISDRGTNDRIITSHNGIDWVTRPSEDANEWNGIAYGNDVFVIVGATGDKRVMTSGKTERNITPHNNIYQGGIKVNQGITTDDLQINTKIPAIVGQVWSATDAEGHGKWVESVEPLTESWITQVTPLNSNWRSVTYGNSIFVAVSDTNANDRVMTSPDGINWTPRTTPVNNEWYAVTYGNGLFVAVASSGTNDRVMVSPDGINWTIQVSPEDNNWNDVAYGNGIFVAISFNGTNRVMTSPDGVTWELSTTPVNNGWLGITYGNGLFVVVSYDGTNRVMTSPDGITWTSRATPANEWNGVTYGNGLFVAVADIDTGDHVMISPDGIDWTPVSSPGNNKWVKVTYGNGLFVAVARDGTDDRVMTSPDGINWTFEVGTPIKIWQDVTYGNGIFVAVALSVDGVITLGKTEKTITPSNNIYQGGIKVNQGIATDDLQINTEVPSVVGQTWTAIDVEGNGQWGEALPPPADLGEWEDIPGIDTNSILMDVTYSDELSLFVAVGGEAVTGWLFTSPDGVNWTKDESAISSKWGGIIYGNGIFVAVSITQYQYAGGTQIMTSINGIDWVVRTSPGAGASYWAGIAYGNGIFVVVGNENRIITSEGGADWIERTAPVTNQTWTDVVFGNGIFVTIAIEGAARIMTSPDGINWTIQAVPINIQWMGVAYGNDVFVAVARDGDDRIMTSPDGVTWAMQTGIDNGYWHSIKFGNGLFCTVSGNSTDSMFSPNGVNWEQKSLSVGRSYRGIAYGNDLFVVVSMLNSISTIEFTADTDKGKFVDGANPLDAVYMDGNVGIGTDSPTSELEVVGLIRSTSMQIKDANLTYENVTHAPIYLSGQIGLDDVFSSGLYTGEGSESFHLRISLAGVTDYVEWKKGQDGIWSGSAALILTPVLMNDGISYTFNSTTGHTLNDEWIINVGEELGIDKPIHVDGLGKFEGDVSIRGELYTYSLLRIRQGIKLVKGAKIATDGQSLQFCIDEHNPLFELKNTGKLIFLTPSYETLVTDDNDIPNKKYVDDSTGEGGKFVDGTDPLDAVYMDGNVGINKLDPATELDVNGTITSDNSQIKSDLTITNELAPNEELGCHVNDDGLAVLSFTGSMFVVRAGNGTSLVQDAFRVADNKKIGFLNDVSTTGSVTANSLKIADAAITYENITHDPVYLSGQAGLDDLSSSGLYTSTGNTYFVVKIASASQAPNTVQWAEGRGALSAPIDITGTEQLMQNGVSFTFASTIGHDVNDEWIISAGTQVEIDKSIHVDGTGEFEGDLAIKGSLRSYSLLGIREGIKFFSGAKIATDQDILEFAAGGEETALSLKGNGVLESNIPNYEALVTENNHLVNKKYVDDILPSSAYKQMELSGTTGNQQSGSTTIAHGITDLTKIKSVSISVLADNNLWYPHHTEFAGREFGYKIGTDGINVTNVLNNSGSILNKPIQILITYQE